MTAKDYMTHQLSWKDYWQISRSESMEYRMQWVYTVQRRSTKFDIECTIILLYVQYLQISRKCTSAGVRAYEWWKLYKVANTSLMYKRLNSELKNRSI